jgi:hypothetical protein
MIRRMRNGSEAGQFSTALDDGKAAESRRLFLIFAKAKFDAFFMTLALDILGGLWYTQPSPRGYPDWIRAHSSVGRADDS